MKVLVSFEGYNRDSGVIGIVEPTKRDCLIKVHERLLYGLDDDEKENLSEEDLIQKIEEVNGDGCAYILSIIEYVDKNQLIFI